VFAQYYANDVLAVVSQAWLGPRYQVTSQVNVVNPGGNAQVPHRDYHLGFVPDEHLAAYPAHLHRMSPVLTLQGAVAHCDMPVDSGPTMLLPFSHRFEGGYLAFNRPEFVDFFAEHHVQLPLAKGDAVFFNPALYHGAGSNISADTRRIANLLQISSPFGRAMEALDRTAMVRAVYPALLAMKAAGRPERGLLNAVVATAEGYAFPTNLDSDQPIGTLAPPSQVDTVLAALADDLTPEALDVALRDQDDRRKP
jgi:ectoine hydroxylase-related dioxygenase (phytanoyl-CoA dioxygenase family)